MRLLAFILFFVAGCLGQSTKAELYGIVRDPAGLALSGAGIELVNLGTQARVSSVSDEHGAFRFSALVPGDYEVALTKDGFATLRRGGIMIAVGEQVNLDLTLELGDRTESIEVIAAAPILQAARGTASFVVEQRRLVNLPLDGRNFVPLIALAPGVNLPPGQLLPRVNGSRPRTSEYIYDGVSVLQPEPGQVAYFPIVDAVQDFRVETNSPSAEYGRSNGGVIMVNQKSGTNDFHGTLFEFFRNERLNARNLFATSGAKPRFRRNQYGFVFGGPVQRNKMFFFVDWQGTRLDQGVVRTNTVPTTAQKTGQFAQAIYDPASTSQGSSGYMRSPFTGNRIPLTRVDQATLAVLDRYPAPNVLSGGVEASANNYRRVGSDRTAQDQFDLRLDRYLGARHKVFGRYAFLLDDAVPATPLPDGSGTFTATYIGKTRTRADSVVAEHTATMSPASVNQLRFGFTRRAFDRSSLATGRDIGALTRVPNIPLSSFSDVLPTYDVVGFQQLGPVASGNANFTTSVTQLIENFTWNRGRHSLKMGADVRMQRLDALQPPNPTGNFQFTDIFTASLSAAGAPMANTGNSFASFLLGQVTRFSIDAQSQHLRPRANIAEGFVQDDWRATSRLTVNAGVRYTLNFPSTVVGDRGAVFHLNTQTLDYLGRDGFPRSVRNLEKKNFGPRLGLAFRITDSSVVRAGYSLTWIEQTGITTPFTTPLFPFIQTLGQQSLDNIRPAFVLSNGPTVAPQSPNANAGLGQGVFGVQRDNGGGYAQQWNLSLQKTIGENWSLEAGYLGSKLTRLGVPDINLNQLTIEQLALGSQLTQQVANPFFGAMPAGSSLGTPTVPRAQLLRPFPRFTTVALYRNNVGHSTYHSFQSRIEKRFLHGLTFSLAYTFSRLIDDAGAVFDSAVLTGPVANYQVADSFNRRLEKDVSTGNVPHIASFGGVYELPWGRGRAHGLSRWVDWIAGGWQLAGVIRLQSGSPLAVTQATNLNAFAGFGIQRPNRLSDPTLASDARTTGRWFNTAAFAAAPQFTLGNSSRNPVVGPGYRTSDVMVGKTLPLTERLRAEVRAEAFNVTNTPALGNPNVSFGNPAFGSITTALDPRVFEFVVKLQFRKAQESMGKTKVANRVEAVRKSRGLGASDLARRVDVSRQTIYAIEAGTYVPNTEVALNIARELEVTVDDLFSLNADQQKSPETISADLLSTEEPKKGQAVRVCQIGSRWVSVPVSATPYYLPEADGIVKSSSRKDKRMDLFVFAKDEAAQKRLVLAGCDPAASLLSHMVERTSGVEVVSAAASSKLALAWLEAGKVHIAGSHLEDAATGEFNVPYIRSEFPNEDFMIVTFGRWEEGFVVRPGNPKGIRSAGDLAGKNVRLVNREIGSGSRGLLDSLLERAGVPKSKVAGYNDVAHGHLAAAYSVVAGDADVCLATRSAAQTFGLDFVAVRSARYDLVMRRRTAELPSVKAFLDVLQRATLRRKLEVLAGYDTSQTGALVA